ncbi:hypothetical protein WN55_01761, partial [Dufourea novaeangliae]
QLSFQQSCQRLWLNFYCLGHFYDVSFGDSYFGPAWPNIVVNVFTIRLKLFEPAVNLCTRTIIAVQILHQLMRFGKYLIKFQTEINIGSLFQAHSSPHPQKVLSLGVL